MGYHEVVFLESASSIHQISDYDLPQIVLAGRSNVGKSSFINCILERKKMAYVGKTPGKTRLLNFFEVDKRFIMVDVPGYGYAVSGKKHLINFGKMMEEYFKYSKNLKALIQLVDARHKPSQDDVNMMEFARSQGLKIVLVATKFDKLKNSEKKAKLDVIAKTLGYPVNDIITFSSTEKIGMEKVWNFIDKVIDTNKE